MDKTTPMHLLVPGRHHLLTRFQSDYFTRLATGNSATGGGSPVIDINGQSFEGHIDAIVWAVTSANHSNTRRNPLPAHRREAAIERLAADLPFNSYVYMVDDIGETPRFAEYTLKTIEVASEGRLQLTKENTVLACSTPAVIQMYLKLGFRVLPMELHQLEPESFSARTPWQLLSRIVELGERWRVDRELVSEISPATQSIYERYAYGKRIIVLHQSELLTDDGDLTETRDYNVYVRAFDHGAQRKYDVAKDFVVPGRIVDIGCCTGAVLREMSVDDRLRESDLFGIEVSRQLYAECLHRKQQGAFGNDHVFFYQKDFAAGPMFAPDSINTFTTFSLTHEIASYGGDNLREGKAALRKFIDLLASQLAPGGRWINVDVVGPERGDEPVWLWLNHADGESELEEAPSNSGDERQGLKEHLSQLSTLGRFRRFAQDFRGGNAEPYEFSLHDIDGRWFAELRLEDACEFISKKDYLDNWQSEMHERFCFWSYTDWCEAVEAAGLKVVAGSQSYVNPWIVENRLRGQVKLFSRSPTTGSLAPKPYPVTNIILVAERTPAS